MFATPMPVTLTAPACGEARPWKSVLKVLVILAGYSAALCLACAAVYVRQLHTQGPDAQASAGMYAFGDSVLFVAVFGGVALLPTGLGLYFLRPVRAFWTVLAIGALGLAATGLPCAAALEVLRHWQGAPTLLQTFACLGVLRMLGSPLVGAAFLLCACLAPTRFSRWALAGATVAEGVVAAYAAFHWVIVPRLL
jgi:hypothetical protein